MGQMMLAFALGMMGLGLMLAFVYLALGRTRLYLLYLGLAFVIAGVGTLIGGLAATVFFLVALALLILALLDGIRDSRERWIRLQAEGRVREEAFSAYQAAIARKEAEEEARREGADESRE